VKVNVGPLEQFPEQAVTVVEADGREIGIVRWHGEVHALANLCTHQRGPLCRGTLSGRLAASEPGELELREDAPVLACPWHGWEFDVRTGKAIWDERFAVRTYAAAIEGDCVVVDVGSDRRRSEGSRT
jgi:nitrite reductase (NADH) small subunit